MFEWSSEWKLMTDMFEQIVSKFGKSDIVLFASKINHQLSNYIPWRPNPGAKAIDTFSINSSPTYNYCVPPFSIILKVSSSYSGGTILNHLVSCILRNADRPPST